MNEGNYCCHLTLKNSLPQRLGVGQEPIKPEVEHTGHL